MTQANSSAPSSNKPADPASDPDPLLHLHKMSTTAGLGSQEYVAVNTMAVVAVLFGLASMLAILGWILLVIPVVGVILSIIALRQINNSNGTQTGRGIAFLGLALSGLITIGLFARYGIQTMHTRADKTAIEDLFKKFGEDLNQRKFDEAYDLFDGEFRQRVVLNDFKAHLNNVQTSAVSPPIESIGGNGYVDFNTDDPDNISAQAVMIVHFKGIAGEDRMDVRLRKVDDGWKLNNIAQLFPTPKKPGSGGQGGPPGGPPGPGGQ